MTIRTGPGNPLPPRRQAGRQIASKASLLFMFGLSCEYGLIQSFDLISSPTPMLFQ
jgi:hypothetical protein